MTDARIRELERAFEESGDPAIGGRLLRAREQAGALPKRAIELLALLQDPGALSLRPALCGRPRDWDGLAEWLGWLRAIGPQVNARALFAWLRRTSSLLLASARSPAQEPQAALANYGYALVDELRGWLLRWDSPIPPNSLRALWRETLPDEGLQGRGQALAGLLRCANSAFNPLNGGIARAIDGTAQPLRIPWERTVRGGPVEHEAELVGELVRAINDVLRPWAAGEDEPLAERPPLNLEQVRIASRCGADWEQMRGSGRVRHCSHCERAVFDLSGLARAEAQQLLDQEGQGICARLYRRADGRMLTRDCLPGLNARLDDLAGPWMGDVLFGDV